MVVCASCTIRGDYIQLLSTLYYGKALLEATVLLLSFPSVVYLSVAVGTKGSYPPGMIRSSIGKSPRMVRFEKGLPSSR